MGKLLCDSTRVAESFQGSSPTVPWRDPESPSTPTTTGAWEHVLGLEEQQRRHLRPLHTKGVLWKPPEDLPSSILTSLVFRLSHGGDVSADGNSLFTASHKAMGGAIHEWELRKRTVMRFLEDLGSATSEEREGINDAIRHMYSPDLKNGWGIHVVQELKLLAKKEDRLALDSAMDELVHLGMQR